MVGEAQRCTGDSPARDDRCFIQSWLHPFVSIAVPDGFSYLEEMVLQKYWENYSLLGLLFTIKMTYVAKWVTLLAVSPAGRRLKWIYAFIQLCGYHEH